MIDLDRREPQARQAGNRTGLSQEASERVTRFAVAIAAEIDPGQHHLPVTLVDPAANLAEDRGGAPAAGTAPHERNDAEVAGEAAAVLHLHEGAHAVEPRFGLDAADRADIARHKLRGLLAAAGNHSYVGGHAGERIAGEIGAAARDVNARVRPRSP